MKAIIVLISSFVIVVTLLIYQFINTSNNDFKMVFCDVGQGDAIYIRAFGEDIVIDGGPDARVEECLSAHMPLFDRNIELMVVTHADSDHYAGFIDVLDSYSVSNFATSYGDSDVSGYESLMEKLSEQNLEIRRLSQGEAIRITDELKIDVLWPPREFSEIDDDRNNSSLVMLVDYMDFEVVLTGDLDKEYLNLLLNDLSQIEVFKLAHHGSYTGTDEDTFEDFRPELSVISAGRDNRFGHPHDEVIDALRLYDLNYLTTFKGDIEIISDGSGFQLH